MFMDVEIETMEMFVCFFRFKWNTKKKCLIKLIIWTENLMGKYVKCWNFNECFIERKEIDESEKETNEEQKDFWNYSGNVVAFTHDIRTKEIKLN